MIDVPVPRLAPLLRNEYAAWPRAMRASVSLCTVSLFLHGDAMKNFIGLLEMRVHICPRDRTEVADGRMDARPLLEIHEGLKSLRSEIGCLISRRAWTGFRYEESVTVQILLEFLHVVSRDAKVEV